MRTTLCVHVSLMHNACKLAALKLEVERRPRNNDSRITPTRRAFMGMKLRLKVSSRLFCAFKKHYRDEIFQ